MGKYEGIIEILSSNDYYKAKKLINILNDYENFIKTMIPIANPYIFDRFCKMVEYQMDTDLYYEVRNTFLKKAILNQKDDKVLDYFKDINYDNYANYLLLENEMQAIEHSDDLKNQVEFISNRWLIEYIISYFFRDNYYNFMVNLFQMVSYLSQTKKITVDNEHIKVYSEFKELNKKTLKEKIDFFKKNLNNNYTEMFYDDMRKVKNSSYQELVESSIKLNHDSKIYREDISKSQGLDIYYLNGEEFKAFVKCFAIKKSDLTNQLISNDGLLGHSFSFISDKNIGTIDYSQKGITILFDEIDFNNIMYVHHSDMHAKKMSIQDDYLSEKQNEIFTPNGLISHTDNYNDIYIVGKAKPKALVCYDKILDEDISFAKTNNLSILLINRKKYKRFKIHEDDYMDNTYVL